jgi:hypothetical protein
MKRPAPKGLRWFLLPPLLVAALAAYLKGQEVPRIPLTIKGGTEIPGMFTGPVLGPTRCDVGGNVYLRMYQADDPLAAPVVKLPRDGKAVTRFDMRAARGFERGEAYGFAVSLRGEVYILAAAEEGKPAVVVFRQDGTYDRTIPLDSLDAASRIQVFSSGELLISGRFRRRGQEVSERRVTAVFDASGRVLQVVRLPEEPTAEGEAALKGEEKEQLLELQEGFPGDDGNVYVFRPRTLLRPGSPTPIWVVSPAGEVIRTIKAKPPDEAFRAFEVRQGGGRIAVQFIETKKGGPASRHILSVFNAETGEKEADYEVPIGVGGLLACYTPNGFSFIGTGKEGQLTLEFAPLK